MTCGPPHVLGEGPSSVRAPQCRIVIGAPLDDEAAENGGCAYIYTFNAADNVKEAVLEAKLVPADAERSDNWGESRPRLT